MSKVLLLVARALFMTIFVVFGFFHILRKEPVELAKSKGVPMPDVSVPFSGGMLLTGAFGVITGFYPRLGAGMISTFLLLTNYYMHPFWKDENPQQRQKNLTQFLKNMSLLGASIIVATLDTAVVQGEKK